MLFRSSENPDSAIATIFRFATIDILLAPRFSISMACLRHRLKTAIAAALGYAPSLSSLSRNILSYKLFVSLSNRQPHSNRLLSLSGDLY